MHRVVVLSFLVAVALSHTGAAAGFDGEPDLAFGSGGFVTYDHSPVAGEPQIERGLRLGRNDQGDLVVLVQHRFQDADAQNHPLMVSFAAGGGLRGASLANFDFIAPSEPAFVAADIGLHGEMLAVGEAGGGQQLLAYAAVPLGSGPGYSPRLQTSLPVDAGQGDRPQAVLAMPDGGFVVCGRRRFAAGQGQTEWPICRRFAASATIDPDFGNGSPFAAPGSLFLSGHDIAGLTAGRILAVGRDRESRLLLGGSITITGIAQELAFSARMTTQGAFDPTYCAAGRCDDAQATAPGWRADAIGDAYDYVDGALIERPDGAITRIYDVTRAQDATAQIAIGLHAADGALLHAQTLQLGGWTRAGSQPAVQSDGKVLLPLSFRPDAGTQLGAIARLSLQPASQGLLDPAFVYAPAGMPAMPGVSVIRPTRAGGLPATSVECNAVLVEVDRVSCAGLLRTSDAPLDLDLLLARVRVTVPDPVFDDGFE